MISCYFFSLFQAALVSFATTGEKTVAAVLTCRNELVSTIPVPWDQPISGDVHWGWAPLVFHRPRDGKPLEEEEDLISFSDKTSRA